MFGLKWVLGIIIFASQFRLVELDLTQFSQNGKIVKIGGKKQDPGRATS